MALDKKLSDICERLEWTVREDNDGTIELAKFSPAGEDFNICVDSKDFIQNVKEYSGGQLRGFSSSEQLSGRIL